MAAGGTMKPLLQKISERHLVCQICMDRYKEPKMLDCSHSFCLKCLQQLAETNPTSPKVICPVCRGQTLLIGKEVSELRTDFKSISLLDEIAQHETELCQQETQPPSQGSVSKCSKHTDKDVIMYCESCKQLICTTCIAKDHRMHPATEISEVVDNCKKKANVILAEVGQHHNNFKIAMEDIGMSRKLLHTKFVATKAKISKKADEEIAKEVARIREEEEKLIVELAQTYKDGATKIETAEAANNNDMTKAQNIELVVNQLMDKVNFCENLHLIEKLLQDLKGYTEIQPKQVPHEFAYMDFEGDQKSLGRLRIKEQKLEAAASAVARQPLCKPLTKFTQQKWTLKTEVTIYKNRYKQIQTLCASDVASYSNGDVVVCDSKESALIKILADSNAQSKVIPKELSIKGLTCQSRVTLNNNDLLIVIDKEEVKIFNRKYKCLHQFTLCGRPFIQPSCIAVDEDNLIAVGSCNKISLHKPDGSLVRTLSAPGIDAHLTIHKQQLIYTNLEDKKIVSIHYHGAILFSVDINQSWCPRGVCCDKEGNIYVAIWDEESSSSEIQHYSPDGRYMYTGGIIKGTAYPCGITLTPAGDLVVATDESVQIYHHNERQP